MQCLRLGPFIIYHCDLFEIKHTELFYCCLFDVQYTIVLDAGVSFLTSNLIRVEFKFNRFRVFLFIVVMKILIYLKNIWYQTSFQVQYLV